MQKRVCSQRFSKKVMLGVNVFPFSRDRGQSALRLAAKVLQTEEKSLFPSPFPHSKQKHCTISFFPFLPPSFFPPPARTPAACWKAKYDSRCKQSEKTHRFCKNATFGRRMTRHIVDSAQMNSLQVLQVCSKEKKKINVSWPHFLQVQRLSKNKFFFWQKRNENLPRPKAKVR